MTYPIFKRFSKIRTYDSSVITTEEISIHGKHFRSGTVFFIIGWKEIDYIPYLVLAKGGWQGLIELTEIDGKIQAIK